MKKVLVTGATGFIGRYVIAALQAKGCSIVASSSNAQKIATVPWLSGLDYKPLDLQQLDDSMDYQAYFGNPDAVIHLAWEGLPNYKSDFHITENLPRHLALIYNLVINGQKDITITGTCFEYGMQEGQLSEDMTALPQNPYAIAKNSLRLQLEQLQAQIPFSLKWVRLFYMYGQGQSLNSLLSQLDRALAAGEQAFNMSGGEQVRDYLPVEKVADYIVAIALQQHTTGIINCCSGKGITVKEMVLNHLKATNRQIILNLGYYPYPDYEPMRFWGSNKKIKSIYTMTDPIQQFKDERTERIKSYATNHSLQSAAKTFNTASNSNKYSYNFSWMGRPIIQYPQDIVAMQEIIWKVQPDLIIETGVAHGGSIIYYASILELIGKGHVLGIDIDIRTHNKEEIEKHPMSKRITMLQGSSIEPTTVQAVKAFASNYKKILVVLDSNHTHEHVLEELNAYANLVSLDSYCVVFDTIVEDLPEGYFSEKRNWGIGNNPKTAVMEFLNTNKNFIVDDEIDNKLLISVAPSGYLKRVK